MCDELREAAGLYLHVPFCTSVCPYCDFAVLIAGAERRAAWAQAMLGEIELYSGDGWCFDTVYLGGGTPSSVDPAQLEAVLAAVQDRLSVADDAVLYLEANPEDVSDASAERWVRLGVDVVSLGVQSLDDGALRYLGRRHDSVGAVAAYETLRRAGFGTVSVDLIFGLEDDDAIAWQRQLAEVVELRPDHISCYQLTFHEGTVFGRRLADGRLSTLDVDREADLFVLTHRVLGDAGYEAYEVPNFALGPEHSSRHNQKYWRHQPYLGIGPSAHSFRGRRRWWNRRKLRLWQAAVERGERPIEGEENLCSAELALEAVMLGMRTATGIDLADVRDRYGIDLADTNQGVIERLQSQGLVRVEGTRVAPTLGGMAMADTVARSFEVG